MGVSIPTHDHAFFDGAVEPVNPGGTGGWGFVIYDASGSKLIDNCGVMRARPSMTNNVAEYAAAGAAIKAYKDTGRPGPFTLFGDSKLVVEQMKGNWQVRQGAYIEVRNRLVALIETCSFEIHWQWVPRDQNSVADDLSKQGLAKLGIQPRRRR